MSSSIFYQFKSRKDYSRITFDGEELPVAVLRDRLTSCYNLHGTGVRIAIFNDMHEGKREITMKTVLNCA